MNNREIATICYYSTILIILSLVKCSSGQSMLCTKMMNSVICEDAKGHFLENIESKNIKTITFVNSSLTYLCEQGFSKFTNVSEIIIDECNDTSNALTCILLLPQLTALKITNSNIGEKNFTALQTNSSLATLSLKGNKIHYIDKSYFKHLLRLEEIDLSHNEISTIGPDAFNGLSALRKLDMSYNRLKGAFNNIFRMGVFYNLSRLEEMDLSHNEISTIGPDAFKGLSALRKLDLSGNRLSGDFNPSALGLSVHCVFQSLVVIWPGAENFCYPSERNLYSAPHATTVDPQQGQGQRKEQQRQLELLKEIQEQLHQQQQKLEQLMEAVERQQQYGSCQGREREIDREGTVVDATCDSVKGDSGGGLSVGMVRAVLLLALVLSMLIFF